MAKCSNGNSRSHPRRSSVGGGGRGMTWPLIWKPNLSNSNIIIMNIERIADGTDERRNRVRRQIHSVSVHIDGNPTVVGYIRHRWRHEAMMDKIGFDSDIPHSREI